MTGKKIKPEHEVLTAKELDNLIKYTENELKVNSAPLKASKTIDNDPLDESDISSDTTRQESGLTVNQNRLLYLLSIYSKPASSNKDKETWVRKVPLVVLIYECILLEGLDYDYAPMFTCIYDAKLPLNTSQEGLSDLDALAEEDLLSRLNITTKGFRSTKCYQISESGMERLNLVPQEDRDAINECIFAPGTYNRLLVHYDNKLNTFILQEEFVPNENTQEVVKLYKRESSILDVEEVNYVSSAFIPQCLRGNGRPTFSNAHRAHESAQGQLQIKDTLDEVITLSSVSLVVAEVIPVGPNNLFTINCNLSSHDRVNKGFITEIQDSTPLETTLKLSTGLTKIDVLDFTPTGYVNVEADIHFPVHHGVVQIETFGVSISHTGVVFCGMQIEAVENKVKDNISLDTLARIFIDVNQDSTRILESIISDHQRNLIDFIFRNSNSREKISVLIANEITPQLTATEYLDKGDYENEIKQVIGDVRGSYDISDFDMLLIGSEGLLLVGPNSRKHEFLLCSYLEVCAFNKFIEVVFASLFNLLSVIQLLRDNISKEQNNPGFEATVRIKIAHLGEQICLFKEVVKYIEQGHTGILIPAKPGDEAGSRLFNYLKLLELKNVILMRIQDIQKGVDTAEAYLNIIHVYTQSWTLNQNALESNSLLSKLESTLEYQKETSNEILWFLKIASFLMLAQFGFTLLDRLTGNWTVINSTWFYRFAEIFILETPLFWFVISCISGAIIAWIGYKIVDKAQISRREYSIKNVLNRTIKDQEFKSYILLNQKYVISDAYTVLKDKKIRSILMLRPIIKKTKFRQNEPRIKIKLHINETNNILLFMEVGIKQNTDKDIIALEKAIVTELEGAGIFA